MADIQFYVPEALIPPFEKFKDWVTPSGEVSQENSTLQAWTYQTWYHLSRVGFNCTMTSAIPSNGIFLSTWVPDLKVLWNCPDVFLIGIAADGIAWPSAQLTVVQNPRMLDKSKGCYFVPHWPQPGIIPRAETRGARIEHLHYFGVPGNLAREFHGKEFADLLLRETGVKFSFRTPDKWHDFSETDLVLAVRGLDQESFNEKPATKLYNAWIAGVPAICGTESSMVQCCSTAEDAFFCRSVSDVITFVEKLKKYPEIYERMAARAHQRGEEFCVSATSERWKSFLSGTAVAAHEEWMNQSRARRSAWLARRRVHWLLKRAIGKLNPK